jgi:hypothetical protein
MERTRDFLAPGLANWEAPAKPMWCGNCRKNVKGVLSATGDSFCCALCNAVLPGGLETAPVAPDLSHSPEAQAMRESPLDSRATHSFVPVAADPSPRDTSSVSLAAALETWEIDEDLRHVERRLKCFSTTAATRIDPAHEPQLPVAKVAAAGDKPMSGSLALLGGWSLFVCGAALLLWSWLGNRPDLFGVAIAATMMGQFGLLCGMYLQREVRDEPTPPPVPATLSLPDKALLHSHPLDDSLHDSLQQETRSIRS